MVCPTSEVGQTIGFVVCQFAFEFQPENDRPRNAMVCPTMETPQAIAIT